MASNFPPAPLLVSLADTPAKQNDVKTLHMFLYLLREQVGGDLGLADLSDAIRDLQALAILPVVTTAINYTTTGSVKVNCTALLTVTLNVSPSDGERVRVQPTGNFDITVSGTINGESSMIVSHEYDLVEFTYHSDLLEWRV